MMMVAVMAVVVMVILQRHGSGRLEYFNGNVYDGEWMEDMRHGRGTLTYFSGEVYTGEWLNDKKRSLVSLSLF